MINKEEFTGIIIDIVNKYTSDFNIYSKTKALGDLFEILAESKLFLI